MEKATSQTRSARQLSKGLKHQHTTSMPGLARKAVSKSPLRTKGEQLSRTASFALPTETTTPPAHVRKRSLSASRRTELMPVQEECSNCERMRHQERASLAALSDIKYQLYLCIEALHSWRAGQTAALELPCLEEAMHIQLERSQGFTEVINELGRLQTEIAGLANDVEVLSRHTVWENVSIVKRKEAASREAIVQKTREAKAMLAVLRLACVPGKAAPPPLISTDPALVRSLKLQLQQAVRERLACEVKLKASGEEPEWLEPALQGILENLQLG